jgi:hypothetical protein
VAFSALEILTDYPFFLRDSVNILSAKDVTSIRKIPIVTTYDMKRFEAYGGFVFM